MAEAQAPNDGAAAVNQRMETLGALAAAGGVDASRPCPSINDLVHQGHGRFTLVVSLHDA